MTYAGLVLIYKHLFDNCYHTQHHHCQAEHK